MEHLPKVTVMIANYNGAGYLSACLESLIYQTYDDFEVLIIDDGSTDNSLEICNEFIKRDDRFRIVSLNQNHGVSYVRHIGIPASKGHYIAILDSDDIALPHRLEKQVKYLDDHPNTVLVGGYYGIIDANGKVIRKRKKLPLHDPEIRWRLTFGNCLIHSTVMYRKDAAIKCGGYNPETIYALDMDLYTRLISYGNVEVIPYVLSLWRSHPKSLTKTTQKKDYEWVCIDTVRKSIAKHTKQIINHDEAAALYFNTNTPAKDCEVLNNALIIFVQAAKNYFKTSKTKAQKKQLARFALKHLFKLRKRNESQLWWHKSRQTYENTLRFLISDNNYLWYTDFKLFFPLFQFSPANYIHLIRSLFHIPEGHK